VADQVVVLGSCGAWPEPGRACSGFVVNHDGAVAVLDLGYGTLPRLLSLLGSPTADGLAAIVVTHRHPDHMVDLHGLLRARWFGRRSAAPIPLYAPDGVVESLVDLEEGDTTAIGRVFDWHSLPRRACRAGPFTLESWPLPHFVPNAGVRLSSPCSVVAYTGDTGPAADLAALAAGADLFIAEASDRHQQPDVPPAPPGPTLHLSAAEAGRVAAAAASRRLLLTHFWPGNDRERSRAEAAESFTGELLLADEGLEVRLP
jgi:ribonuclease BN (tRNA processing enzyme)